MRNLLKIVIAIILILSVSTSNVRALDMGTAPTIENLRRRIEELEKQSAEKETVETAVQQEETEKGFFIEIADKKLKIWGSVELNAIYDKQSGQDAESDLVVDEVQLGFEPRINDKIGAHLVFKYEDGGDFDVDEANISISQYGEGQGYHFIGGLLYLPFGNYSSNMITDPLTLELGETRETAVIIGWANDFIDLKIGTFNGDVDTTDGDNIIDSLVAALEVNSDYGVTAGISFINDLAESDIELLPPDQDHGLRPYGSNVSAVSAYVAFVYGMWALHVEFVSALEEFDQVLVEPGESLTGSKPWAFDLELTVSPLEGWNFSLRFEKAKDFLADPDRYGITVSYGIFRHTILALEYLRTEADVDIDTLTLQLAFGF